MKLPALKSKNEVGKYHEDFFRHAETQASRFLNRQVKGLNLEDFLTSISVQSKQIIQELHDHNNSQTQQLNKFSIEEIQGLTNQYTELSEKIKSAMNMETVQNKDKTNENSIGPKASIMTPQVSSTFKSPPHIINTSTTNATLTAEEYKILNQESKELIKYAKNSEMKKFEWSDDPKVRRRSFKHLIINLKMCCSRSICTQEIFSDWPSGLRNLGTLGIFILFDVLASRIDETTKAKIEETAPFGLSALSYLKEKCAQETAQDKNRIMAQFILMKIRDREPASKFIEDSTKNTKNVEI